MQFQLWLEAVETALGTLSATSPLKERMLATGRHTVDIESGTLYATLSGPEVTSDALTFQSDELVPGLFFRLTNEGVHLVAQDAVGWLSVFVACAAEGGTPITVHRTLAPQTLIASTAMVLSDTRS